MTPHEDLLRSLVEMTLAVFDASACSIMRFDKEADELVFEAVAGEGAGTLVGRRLPARTGIAGWVLASEEPIAISDVLSDPRFARGVAEETGYVPKALTVFPLLHAEEALGVLNVLDAGASGGGTLGDMETLGRVANHAAGLLALVQAARVAQARQAAGIADPLAKIAEAMAQANASRRDAANSLLDALSRLLR